MTTTITMPEPAFRLTWHEKSAAYKVNAPNVCDTDCFTAAQLQAYGDARMLEERERCVGIVENSDTPDGWSNSHIAEQLRKGTV